MSRQVRLMSDLIIRISFAICQNPARTDKATAIHCLQYNCTAAALQESAVTVPLLSNFQHFVWVAKLCQALRTSAVTNDGRIHCSKVNAPWPSRKNVGRKDGSLVSILSGKSWVKRPGESFLCSARPGR